MLPDLHTGFSRGRSGGLVFPSLSEFPQFIVIHTVKGLGIVNKAVIDVFLKFSCLFDDLADVGNLISGSSAFSKSSLNIWKFSVHILLYSSVCSYSGKLLELPRWLSGKEFTYQVRDVGSIPRSEDPLRKEMATHSNILAWEIPGTEEPGGL